MAPPMAPPPTVMHHHSKGDLNTAMEAEVKVKYLNVWLRFCQFLTSILLLLVILAACSQAPSTLTTEGVQPSPSTSVPRLRTSPPPSTSRTSVAAPPPMVLADANQEGFAAPMWDDGAYGEPAFVETIVELADTGAEWVTLVPTWYQTAPESSIVYPERPGRTATDEALIAAITSSRGLGLQVMLKPHVDVTDGGSRLRIDPADHEQWFDSYGQVIVAYARLAQEHDVSQFVVGTELAGISDETDLWRDLIESVRQVYSGPLTYAANHDEYLGVRFWDVLDFVGVDAYFPLADEPTSDATTLVEAWEPIVADLRELSGETGRSIVFTEVGYPSQDGAVTAPFDPHRSTVVSAEEQDAALRAMLAAFEDQPWFGGFHWWMWFEESSEEAHALGYSPQGKPSEATLRDRWDGP